MQPSLQWATGLSIYRFEIIVADDGSTDCCEKIVSDLASQIHNLKLIRYPNNMGRGFVLSKAIKQSSGNIICYIDADLQIDPEVILRLVRCIQEGFDIAIGSKHHPDSKLFYSPWRKIQSLVYNRLARYVLNLKIQDFQCGAKAFKRASIIELLKYLSCKRWSWDTELILKAIVLGYQVIEIPVIIRPIPNRRSQVHLRSIFIMSRQLFRLWLCPGQAPVVGNQGLPAFGHAMLPDAESQRNVAVRQKFGAGEVCLSFRLKDGLYPLDRDAPATVGRVLCLLSL